MGESVGLICALSLEFRALIAIFDEEPTIKRAGKDLDILYHTGRIGEHSAVAACLPEGRTGSVAATNLARCMNDAFPSLKLRFMVGIAGGIPHELFNIRLGDIVIGTKIVQYDFGKRLPNSSFKRTREPFHVPKFVPNAISVYKAKGEQKISQKIDETLSVMRDRRQDSQNEWTHPGENQDRLFKAQYAHNILLDNPLCEECDERMIVPRELRGDLRPIVHDGLIASADQVMRDGFARDQLKSDLIEALAVEMEAAGLEDHDFGVIRGICDYADSHKNKQWQPYASATAAAFTRVLLGILPPANVSAVTDVRAPVPPGRGMRRLTDTDISRSSSSRALANISQASSVENLQSSDAFIEPPTVATNSSSLPESSHRRAQTFSGEGSTRHRFRELSIATPYQRSIDYQRGQVSDRQAIRDDPRNERTRAISLPISDSTTSVHSPPKLYEIQPSPHEVQLFSMASIEYSVTFRDKPKNYESTVIRNHNSQMLLLQIMGDRYFEISRKLLFQRPKQNHRPISLWLPFDRIVVSVQGRVVELKFSDCNAKQSRTVQGMSRYSAGFNTIHRNIGVSITFPGDHAAREFANHILCMNCMIDRHSIIDFRQPVRSSQGKEFKLYQCFETREKTGPIVNYLMIKSSITDGHETSEAFFLGPNLNVKLEMSCEGPRVEFQGLQTIRYLSREETMPCWPLPWIKENPEGKPQRIDLEKHSALTIGFHDESSYQNFMSATTGWQLEFTGDTEYRSYKRGRLWFRSIYSKGQVTLWSKSMGSGPPKCCVVINLYEEKHTVNKWISLFLKAPGKTIATTSSSIEHDRDNGVTCLDDVQVFHGTHIVRATMLAGPSAERDSLQPSQRQEFKFKNKGVWQQFADALEKMLAMIRTSRIGSS